MVNTDSNLEFRIMRLIASHPKGIKPAKIHSKLRDDYEILSPILDDLVKRGFLSKSGKFYKPDNISAYYASRKYH